MAQTPETPIQQSPFIPPLPAWLGNLRDWLWLIGAGAAVWLIYRSRGRHD